MISVKVIRDNDKIESIDIIGHSGYDVIGKDIVCSSVSTAMILTINLLEKLNCNFSYQSNESIPQISLNINDLNSKKSNLIQTILENLVNTLDEISKQYKKYLKINEIRR